MISALGLVISFEKSKTQLEWLWLHSAVASFFQNLLVKMSEKFSRFIAFYIGKCLFVFVYGWFEISKNWRTLCHCRRKWTCPQSVLSKSSRRHEQYDYDPSSGIKATKCWSIAVAGSTPPSKAWISPWFLKNEKTMKKLKGLLQIHHQSSCFLSFVALLMDAYGLWHFSWGSFASSGGQLTWNHPNGPFPPQSWKKP